ncbi:SusC/RagA family TonB-linked outer membrane protein [Flagellimonas hadalis]|uniref:SusC/RagA family TonB-linked outer membrane protein n=2 Tax=Flagellimonas hadalis TaxID=2597517 RepID=A0A5N5IQJ8_9FLAO|nr:SusC/RagA family TonB-linked outer membrane protein [Allomuricauda hadalis]
MNKSPKCICRTSWFLLLYIFLVPFLTHKMQAGHSLEPPQASVSGTVTDTSGNPLAGVNLVVESKNVGTISALDGSFSINAGPDDVLVFSMVGFKTLSMPISGRDEITVMLEEDVTQLGEVVLNAGYYTVTEKERTGNISKVTASEFEKQPVSNPLAALQGRMPGVSVTQTSGLPGAGFNIQIRGRNSIGAGNDPLYIVDGVPFASDPINYSQTSGILGGTISPLNGINPADIEKIEVLKDADATAIYGSRGANGVVLVTTKNGRSGKAALNIHLNTTLGRVTRFMDLLSTPQYLEMRREAFANDGIGDYPANAYDVNGIWDQDRYTDWQKELIGGTVHRTMAQASVSGGSNGTRYLMSGTYQKENTVFPSESGYQKGSVLLNLDHASEDGRFKLHFSGNYVVDHNNLPAADLTRISSSLAPNAPALYDEDGELNWADNTWNNPLAELESRFSSNSKTLTTNGTASYAVLKGVTAKLNLGYTDARMDDSRVLPSTRYNPAFGADSRYSSVYKGTSSRTSWIVEPQLQWQGDMGPLQLDVLLGSTFQQQNQQQLGLYAQGFPSNELLGDISAATTLNVNLDSGTEYRYQAIFGRINLNYRKKYILNLTARRDGSSRFGPGNQFANFGAIGAAWLFSEENFIKEALPVISYGKLRGSYGTTGNDQIGDYQFWETYSLGGTNYDGVSVLRPTRLFNPDFGWERNDKLEVGLEFGLWKDRILLAGNYYRNRSSNQLVGIPMPGTTGYTSLQANLDAIVQNNGVELEVTSRLVHTPRVKWQLSLNLSLPENKLISFPGLEASTYANSLVVGKSLGIRKLYYSTGVDPTTGVYQFRDYDGDGVISSPNDQQWTVDMDPDLYGGLANNISIGRFELDFLFQFTKQQQWNYLYNGGFPSSMMNQPVDVLDRWRQAGESATLQRYTTGNNADAVSAFYRYSSSNRAVSDGSFVRLKTASISYQVPSKLTKGMDCRVYLQGQNLWTWTSYRWGDPEFIGVGRLPPLRQITLGAQLTF